MSVQNLEWVEYLWTDDYCDEARVRLGQGGSEGIRGSLGSHKQAEFSASPPNLPFVRTRCYFCVLHLSVTTSEESRLGHFAETHDLFGAALSSLGTYCSIFSIFGRISEPGGKAQACGNTECGYLSNSRTLCQPSPCCSQDGMRD